MGRIRWVSLVDDQYRLPQPAGLKIRGHTYTALALIAPSLRMPTLQASEDLASATEQHRSSSQAASRVS